MLGNVVTGSKKRKRAPLCLEELIKRKHGLSVHSGLMQVKMQMADLMLDPTPLNLPLQQK